MPLNVFDIARELTRPRARALALAGFAGLLLFTAVWAILSEVEPGYDLSRQTISELGAQVSEHRRIANLGIAVFGLSAGAIGLALASAFPPGAGRWIAVTPLLLCGIGGVGEAVFTYDCWHTVDLVCRQQANAGDLSWHHAAHNWSGGAAQTGIFLSPFALALAIRMHGGPRWLGLAALAAGLFAVFLGLAFGLGDPETEPNAGVYQRVLVLAGTEWLGLIALGLLGFRMSWERSDETGP